MSMLSLVSRPRRVGAWSGLAGLLAAAALAGAATPASAAEAPIVHGVVKDTAGHKIDGYVRVLDAASGDFLSTQSVVNGEYAFRLSAGSYKLYFDDEGSPGLAAGEYYNDKGDLAAATTVVIGAA